MAANDPNQPPDEDPFEQIMRTGSAGAPANDDDDPFAKVMNAGGIPPESQSSTAGAFARSAVRGAAPAATGLAAFGPGAEAGAFVGLAGGPFAEVTSPIGGLIGGLGAMYFASKYTAQAQDYALSKVPDTWRDPIGLSDRQQQLDESEHPIASFLGGVAPYALTMRPGGFAKAAAKLPENATAFQRIMANPVTARLFGGAAMGGMELGQEAVEDPQISWPKVAISTGFGLVFNKPTRLGEAITELGATPVRAALDRLRPTVAQAGDAKVMGAGITEPVFQGTHEQAPPAAMAAQEAARAEQASIGAPPPAPEIHDIARRLDPDTFADYDELKAQRATFQTWIDGVGADQAPTAVKHLAAIDAEMRELDPRIAAAYRRAAEASGAQTVEPPAPPAPVPELYPLGHRATPVSPEVPGTQAPVEAPAPTGAPAAAPAPPPAPVPRSIEEQRAFIAGDVARQLVAAGRPAIEAQAAGQLVAAKAITRAARFQGRLGTAEELYRREGAEIRGPRGRQGAPTPAPPLDLSKIDATHDVVSGANSSKDPNGPVYIDRRIPQLSPTLKDRSGQPANLWKYLSIHERDEAQAMARGMSYADAHKNVATPAERDAVEADGVSWDAYTHEIDGYLAHIEKEKTENPPPDTHIDPQEAIGHHRSENKQVEPDAEIAVRARAPSRKPESKWSLLEFLAARGGIRADDPLIGDVKSSIGKPNRFVPGFGQLIRKTGMPLDRAREAAIEAGYLFDIGDVTGGQAQTTVKTLLDAVDEELRGNKVYRHGEREPEAEPLPHEVGTSLGEETEADRQEAERTRELVGDQELYQRDQSPLFYSAVQRSIEAAKQEKASPQQWLGPRTERTYTIKDEKTGKERQVTEVKYAGLIGGLPGVKPEEIEWLGLPEWLKGHERPGANRPPQVTKQEILDYIRANQIEVREVTKGAGVPKSELDRLRQERWAANEVFLESDRTTPEGRVASDAAFERYRRAVDAFDDATVRNRESAGRYGPGSGMGEPLPGGENYREMLLTLPDTGAGQLLVVKYPGAEGFTLQRSDGTYIIEPAGSVREGQPVWWKDRDQAERTGVNVVRDREGHVFRSTHWDEPNVLAHVRFDDRVTDGKRTLHLTEVQSDWHQAGRKRGYADDVAKAKAVADAEATYASIKPDLDRELAEAREQLDIALGRKAPRFGLGDDAALREAALIRRGKAEQALSQAATAISDARHMSENAVPDAPFKTTWPELALKRMIRYAAENGYDQLSWDTGETNAERYDLSKQVKQIEYNKQTGGNKGRLEAIDHSGNNVLSKDVSDDELPDIIGKEAAERLLNSPKNKLGTDGHYQSLSGLDLKVGGEGMRGFYDKILPAAVSKLTKKFGAKVGMADLNRPDANARVAEINNLIASGAVTGDAATDLAAERGRLEEIADHELGIRDDEGRVIDTPAQRLVHTVDITDKLREAATEQGFPLFQAARGGIVLNPTAVPGRDFLGVSGIRPILKIAEIGNASTFIHESGHQYLAELMRDAEHPLAPDDLKADAKTAMEWLGVKSSEDIKRRHQEKFATGFEQYLREGIAPSPALANVFAKFKSWLLSIYRTIQGLGQPINDDIRGVFDRMLATEPQRTVIAPERTAGPTLADIHKTEAAATESHESEPRLDLVSAEADRYVTEPPGNIAHEIAQAESEADAAITAARSASGGTAAEPGAEGGPGATEAGQVADGSQQPEPVPEGGGVGAGRGNVVSGGGGPGAKGAGVPTAATRSEQPEPAQSARDQQPLAPSPATSFGPRESPLVDKAGNIRIENLTTREDVAQAIREAADANNDFVGERRGVITDGQVMDLADALGMDLQKLNRRKIGQAFNAEQIIAARQLLIQSATDVGELMRQAATGTDEDVMAYAQARDRHQMIQAQVAGITAEAGRALRAFRTLAGQKNIEGIDQFLRGAMGKTLFQLREEAKLGSTMDTPQKVSQFMQDAQKRTFGRMILEYWINGLISGPATHTTYMVGNTILTLEKVGPETALAALIGQLRTAIGREGETVRMGEVAAQLRGAKAGAAPALKAAIEAFRTGVATALPGEVGTVQATLPFQPGTELAQPAVLDEAAKLSDAMGAAFGLMRGMRDGFITGAALLKAGGIQGEPLLGFRTSPLGVIPDITVRGVNVSAPLTAVASAASYAAGFHVPIPGGGTQVRLPGRFIAAIHSLFRSINYSMEKAGGAYRVAANEGLSGTAFDARIAEIRQNPSEQQMEQWRAASTELTLMGKGSPFVQALSRLTNTEILGFPILKFIDPFVHIAGNIIDQSIIQRTPAGLLAPEIRADLMGKNGNIAQDMAMARMLAGTAIAVTFGGLAAEGLISGSGPSDPKQSAMWRLAGNQAHSVRIGDTWYAVNKLGPMGMLLGISADMYDVAHTADKGEYLQAASMLQHAFTQNILDESFMRGPAELIQALEDPGRYGEAYLKNFLSSFVPYSVAMAQMDRATDPYSRQARTVVDAIKAKVPGLSEQLFPRIDIWGQPMPNAEALGHAGVTAIYERQMSRDPVNIAMVNLSIAPAQVERSIRNVHLTDAQYDDFARIAGRMTKQRLDAIVSSPDWQTWPNQARHDILVETIRQSREAARGMMMMKYPTIARDAVQAKLQKLGGVE